MVIRIRVTKPDMNGFCGRDHHPMPEDAGVLGTVTNIDLAPGDDFAPTEPDEAELPMYTLTNGEFGPQMFFAILDNDRHVQLLCHEFELVSCHMDGDL